MSVQLTPSQEKFLRLACGESGERAIETYAPVVTLLALGFIYTDGRMVNWHKTWHATEAGKAWVAARNAKRTKRRMNKVRKQNGRRAKDPIQE